MNNLNDFENIDFNLIETILKQLPSNIYFKDSKARYVFCTHYWNHLKIDENDPNWTIKGKTDLEIRKDKENAILAYENDMQIINTGVGSVYTIKFEENGIIQYLELIKNPVFDKDGKVIGIVGLINDVTKRVELEKELNNLAKIDSLTGAFNRTYLECWLNNENNENVYPLSIISGDCNGLKYINDTYGHSAGDEYIKKTVFTMQTILPSNASIIRMGGDEFIAILPKKTKEEVKTYIEQLNSLSSSLKIEGETLSVSFGSVTIFNKIEDFNLCLSAADSEMYKVKAENYKTKKMVIR